MSQSKIEQTLDLDGYSTETFLVVNGRRYRVACWRFEDGPYVRFQANPYDGYDRAYLDFPRRISFDIRHDPPRPKYPPGVPDNIVLGEN